MERIHPKAIHVFRECPDSEHGCMGESEVNWAGNKIVFITFKSLHSAKLSLRKEIHADLRNATPRSKKLGRWEKRT